MARRVAGFYDNFAIIGKTTAVYLFLSKTICLLDENLMKKLCQGLVPLYVLLTRTIICLHLANRWRVFFTDCLNTYNWESITKVELQNVIENSGSTK